MPRNLTDLPTELLQTILRLDFAALADERAALPDDDCVERGSPAYYVERQRRRLACLRVCHALRVAASEVDAGLLVVDGFARCRDLLFRLLAGGFPLLGLDVAAIEHLVVLEHVDDRPHVFDDLVPHVRSLLRNPRALRRFDLCLLRRIRAEKHDDMARALCVGQLWPHLESCSVSVARWQRIGAMERLFQRPEPIRQVVTPVATDNDDAVATPATLQDCIRATAPALLALDLPAFHVAYARQSSGLLAVRTFGLPHLEADKIPDQLQQAVSVEHVTVSTFAARQTFDLNALSLRINEMSTRIDVADAQWSPTHSFYRVRHLDIGTLTDCGLCLPRLATNFAALESLRLRRFYGDGDLQPPAIDPAVALAAGVPLIDKRRDLLKLIEVAPVLTALHLGSEAYAPDADKLAIDAACAARDVELVWLS